MESKNTQFVWALLFIFSNIPKFKCVLCVFFHHLWHMTNRTKQDAFKQNHVKWYNIHHQAFIFRMARAFFSLSVSQIHLNKPGTKFFFSFSECLCIVNRQTFFAFSFDFHRPQMPQSFTFFVIQLSYLNKCNANSLSKNIK